MATFRVTRALGPRTSRLPTFSSDSAVTVLMSNAREWSLFDAYFWGQDRFGAWPFLLARSARALFGFAWTDLSLHGWLTAWTLVGVAAVALLAPRLRLLAAGLFAVVVLFHPTRWALFELAQVYAWQLTALLLAWCCLRAFQSATGVARELGLGALAALVSFLAVWSSTVSGPLLALVAGMEALRSKCVTPTRALRWRWVKGLAPVSLAIVGEALLRRAYHRGAAERFGTEFRTALVVDHGHLTENASAVFQHLVGSGALFALAISTVGAAMTAVTLARALRQRGEAGAPLSVDAAALIGTSWAIAMSQLPLLTLVSHVRLNEYNPRYFALLQIFAAFAAALTVASLLSRISPLRRAAHWAGAALLFATFLALPSSEETPDSQELRATAERLAQNNAGRPLLGGYWDTYVFAALQTPERMTLPVPADSELQRTFWWADQVRRSSEVVGVLPLGAKPARWMYQYGALLQLQEAKLDSGANRSFALYRNAQALLRPTTAQPEIAQWDLCRQAPLRLSFDPLKQGQVYVLRNTEDFALGFSAVPLLEDGSQGAAVAFAADRRNYRAELSSAGPRIVGVSIQRTGALPGKVDGWQCGLESAVVAELPALD